MAIRTGIGPHCCDGYSQSKRDEVMDIVRSLNPAWVNILRASNPNESFWLAQEIAFSTDTKVLVRHCFGPLSQGDERVIITYPNPKDYFKEIVRQYKGSGLVLVAGNEQTTAKYDVPQYTYREGMDVKVISYVHWMVQLMRYAHDENIPLAVFRFPAWHPYLDQFSQFEQEVVTYDFQGGNPQVVKGVRHAFSLYPGMILSPNWYYSPGNWDAIEKGILWWESLGKPPMVIGEFGILKGPTLAHDGYRSMGMSAEDAAEDMVSVWETYLKPHNIPACFFNYLTWYTTDSFEWTRDGVKSLERRKERIMLSPPETETQIISKGSVRLRLAPDTQSLVIGYINAGSVVSIPRVGTETVPNGWLFVRYEGRTGYVMEKFLKERTTSPEYIQEEYKRTIGILRDKLQDVIEMLNTFGNTSEEDSYKG